MGNIRASNWNGNQTLEGALLEGVTVCAGYSKALCYILNKAGIECRYIAGDVNDPKSRNNAHAWNQVKINGKWYNTDLTWDIKKNPEVNVGIEHCLRGKKDPIFRTRVLDEGYKDDDVSEYDYNRGDLIQKSRSVELRIFDKDFKLNFPRHKEREESILLCTKGATKQEIIDYKRAMAYAKSEKEKDEIYERFQAKRLIRKKELRKKAQKIELSGSLSDKIEYLMHCRERGIMVYTYFKGRKLYSTDFDLTADKAYTHVVGLSKKEYLDFGQELVDTEFAGKDTKEVLDRIQERMKLNVEREKAEERENEKLIRKYESRNEERE